MIRWLVRGLIALIALYALVVGGFYVAQRPLLFITGPGHETPPVYADRPITVQTLTTQDGVKLVGWYMPPKPGQPVILFFHGQRGGLARHKRRWDAIHAQGAGFLVIGYRGFSGSEGSPSEVGLHKDADAAWAWLSARHRPETIVIHGYSLGSGVASKLATRTPDARMLVLEAPFTAAVDVAAETYPFLPASLIMKDQFRSRDWIGEVKIPVLIVHGTADTTVPFSHGQKLYTLVQSEKTFVSIEGAEHNELPRRGLYPVIWKALGLTENSVDRP